MDMYFILFKSRISVISLLVYIILVWADFLGINTIISLLSMFRNSDHFKPVTGGMESPQKRDSKECSLLSLVDHYNDIVHDALANMRCLDGILEPSLYGPSLIFLHS